MAKIQSMTVHFDGTVTLWFEGQDSMSDYFPAIHSIRQKQIQGYMDQYGVTDFCFIHGTNHRDAGKEWDKDHKSALRLSKKFGITFKDQVRFPVRETKEEAAADAALEPTLNTEVQFLGGRYVNDGTKWSEIAYSCRVI